MTPAIVVLGYNRIKSIERLLKTLNMAAYPNEVSVPLIIDLDNCGSNEIYEACLAFEWNHGEKKVILRSERMGLREHVLACGDFSYEYGSIIMFEDDMMVSPMFYQYACEALDFCNGDERIGGISLYNHLYNVHARRSFVAIDDGYDNWYFQFASSWGQTYTGAQWKLFRDWYEIHKDDDLSSPWVPDNVSSWSAKSWLKYHICYLIDTGKYFMYPRVGYSTNCGDAGSHFDRANTDLQIPLGGGVHKEFRFAGLEESGAVYDAFFENERLRSVVAEKISENGCGGNPDIGASVVVDLYGLKNIREIMSTSDGVKYILSRQRLPFRVIASYGRFMRPVDANIYYEMEGNDFYLYDALASSDDALPAGDEASEYLYEYRGISADQMKKIIGFRIKEKFRK